MVKKLPILPLFLVTEALLYIAFLYCDIVGYSSVSTALKYTALLLCLLFSFDSITEKSEKDSRLVCIALTFTAMADLFLLVLNRWYAVGVAFFCPVQILYALRLRRLKNKHIPLWPRILLSGGAIIAVVLWKSLDPLTLLVCIYFPQLVCNAVESLFQLTTSQTKLFALGLWLFLGCDICVGLNNMSLYIPVTGSFLMTFVQIGMWAFYLPSQVLIVLSASRRLHS